MTISEAFKYMTEDVRYQEPTCEDDAKKNEEVTKIIAEALQKAEFCESKNLLGTTERGIAKLYWENIRIIVDDKTIEIWQNFEDMNEKPLTLNECLKIARKELGYTAGPMLILCESFLKGIIYRYGNHINSKGFEIAGIMNGFA